MCSWLLSKALGVKLGVSVLASSLETKIPSLQNSLPPELSYSIAGLQGPNVLLAAGVQDSVLRCAQTCAS